MAKEDKQQELQQKYMEMQMLGQQVKQSQKQIELLAQQVEELHITNEALGDISKAKTGSEILVPMASGIFVKGQLTDNKEVVVNVGAGTAVKKPIPKAKELINMQLKEIGDFKKELEASLQQFMLKAKKLENELSELVK